jgi:outer membrane murein-binding lipoprotein Lpp
MKMRSKLSIFLLFAALSCAAGCTPWPQEGGGGFAERHPIASSATASSELRSLADRLQSAIERGARQSYAAQTAEAELQLVRAQRTWDAGFVEDYIKDYQVLVVLVQDVEAHISGSNRSSRKRVQ